MPNDGMRATPPARVMRDQIPTDKRCTVCDGYGNIWVGWNPNAPVTCGHCHGTGKRS